MFILGLLAVAASMLSNADSSLTSKRDKALAAIKACIQRNTRANCKHINRHVQTLVEVYRDGDKSVLATLMRFTYLTDFYEEALLSDPDGFLSVMAQLPAKDQEAVAAGLAGEGTFRLIHQNERFAAIRAVLAKVPEGSPTKGVAEISLKIVEGANASLFVNYFPPNTFTSPSADFQVAWYSSDMYQLGEIPLWPPTPDNERTYRFTCLGAFTGPQVVTLRVHPDGSGKARVTVLDESRHRVKSEKTSSVTRDQVSDFLKRLDRANFWQMATESPQRGFDGAEWIMEGVQGARYHIAVRWCPGVYEKNQEDAAFADALRFLFHLAGHEHGGNC